MKTLNKKQLILTGEKSPIDLAGVNFRGIQYYDLGQIIYINSSGIADLISILKIWTSQGIKVIFVNVPEKIKKRIYDMGLKNIFYMD